LGDKIRRIREERKLSQEKLAELAGVSSITVYKIETGREQTPKLRVILQLSRALNVPLEELARAYGTDPAPEPDALRQYAGQLQDIVQALLPSEESPAKRLSPGLGGKLRQAREYRQLSNEQLSARTGISRTTIYGIETGQNRNPSFWLIVQLSRALNIPLEELADAYEQGDSPVPDTVRQHVEQLRRIADGLQQLMESETTSGFVFHVDVEEELRALEKDISQTHTGRIDPLRIDW
jgi:transcriptional regulator with XRE-family HTH domain